MLGQKVLVMCPMTSGAGFHVHPFANHSPTGSFSPANQVFSLSSGDAMTKRGLRMTNIGTTFLLHFYTEQQKFLPPSSNLPFNIGAMPIKKTQ